MPAITYYDLGHNRPLHQLVFAGTHDSGITSGAENAQTQDLNIFEQAEAGARIFDVRVTANVLTERNGKSIIQMQTFHADPKLMKNKKVNTINVRTDQESKQTRTILRSGEWGLSLSKVLQQSKRFVEDNPTEFLLLKFDKCKNWGLIAEACIDILGGTIYTGGGNINTKTLFDLRGKVIPMLSQKGSLATNRNYTHGINVWKNLKSEKEPGKSYMPNFNGLTYYGGGGTNPLAGGSAQKKVQENIEKQGKKMKKMAGDVAAGAPEVLGMLYWTTTGLFKSIRERDAIQWNQQNHTKLAELWAAGLEESITTRLPNSISPTNYSSGGLMKVFMPNFIMVDFIDAGKGRFIKDLNNIAATQLTRQALFGRIGQQGMQQIYGN